MADKTFRQAILASASEVDLNLRQRVKLRLVLRLAPEELAREVLNQAQVEGVLPVTVSLDDAASDVAAVDWEALAKFIKEVLPVILEVIKLFL